MTKMFLAAVAIAGLALSGCGSGPKKSAGTHPPKVFIEWDDSGFTRFAPSYKDEIVGAIQHIAAAGGEEYLLSFSTASPSRQPASPSGTSPKLPQVPNHRKCPKSTKQWLKASPRNS